MDIKTNVPLKPYTTMRLGGPARFMADATSSEAVQLLCRKAAADSLAVFVLGGGSNTIVHDEGFAGLIIRNCIEGIEIIDDTARATTLRVGAGENWDEVVKRTVDMGLSGIEALSAIPGTVGGAPVQNIGAYGQDIADTLVSVDVYDRQLDAFSVLDAETCELGYRHSIFRGHAANRYIITAVTFTLKKTNPQPPFYAALETYFASQSITQFTPRVIRDAVIAIRKDKLPDPTLLPNAGSFFKNAIVNHDVFEALHNQHADMPYYTMPDGQYKIPTGWLIERTGLKGMTLYGIHIHDKNALVLINENATGYADLAGARDEIIDRVKAEFGIVIEQEPLELS